MCVLLVVDRFIQFFLLLVLLLLLLYIYFYLFHFMLGFMVVLSLCFGCTSIHRLSYTVGLSSPEGAQFTVRGGGFVLYRDFSVGYFVCYNVFVVYISLRDDGR
jgi:hypothetical protein